MTRTLAVIIACVLPGCRPTGSDMADLTESREVSPGVHVLTAHGANTMVLLGGDRTVVVGYPRTEAVAAVGQWIRSRTEASRIYAVLIDGDSADALADGGWAQLGATTIAHEMHYAGVRRLRRSIDVGQAAALEALDMPEIGFSNVIQLFLSDEEVHVVHPRRGVSYSDLIVHLHDAGVLYLGNTFSMDGYPDIRPDWGGSIEGLRETISFFLTAYEEDPASIEPIVPGRGRIASMEDLRAYFTMLSDVSQRIERMSLDGMAAQDIVAARPSKEYDDRWGRGEVTPDEFVSAILATMVPRTEPTQHGH